MSHNVRRIRKSRKSRVTQSWRMSGVRGSVCKMVLGTSLESRVRWMERWASSTAIASTSFAWVNVIIMKLSKDSLGNRPWMFASINLKIFDWYWQIAGIWMWVNVMLRGQVLRRDRVMYTCWIPTGRSYMMGCVLQGYRSEKGANSTVTCRLLGS